MEILSYENGFLFQRVDEIKKYIFCMKNGEVSIQQDLTREFPNGSYKIVDSTSYDERWNPRFRSNS